MGYLCKYSWIEVLIKEYVMFYAPFKEISVISPLCLLQICCMWERVNFDPDRRDNTEVTSQAKQVFL